MHDLKRVVVFLTQFLGITFLCDRTLALAPLNKRDLRDIVSVLRKLADVLEDVVFDPPVLDDGGQKPGQGDSTLWRQEPTLAPMFYQTERNFDPGQNRIFVDDFSKGDNMNTHTIPQSLFSSQSKLQETLGQFQVL